MIKKANLTNKRIASLVKSSFVLIFAGRINGVVAGKGQPSQLKVCTFEDVKLQTGKNIIEVSAKGEDKKTIADSCTWILR